MVLIDGIIIAYTNVLSPTATKNITSYLIKNKTIPIESNIDDPNYCGSKEHLSKFANSDKSLHRLIMSICNDPVFRDVYEKIVDSSINKLPKCQEFIGIGI